MMRVRTSSYRLSCAVAAVLVVVACGSEDVYRVDDGRPPANRPPTIIETVPEDVTPEVVVGETIRFSVNIADPNDDELTCEFSVDDQLVATDTFFDFEPATTGIKRVRAVVSDGEFTVDHEWLPTVVESVANRAPKLLELVPADATPAVPIGETIRFSVRASDPDGDELTHQFTVNDSVVSNGTFYDHRAEEKGSASVRVAVSDGELEAFHDWSLAVFDPADNRPPEIREVIPADAAPVMMVGGTIRFSVQATDPDGNALDFRFYVEDVLVSTNEYFDFTTTQPGSYRVRVVVSDGKDEVDHVWSVTVGDTIPPSEVHIVSVASGLLLRQIDVRWLAVGDDGLEGRASTYIIAMSDWPIANESDWNSATKYTVDGGTVAPGTQMQFVATRSQEGQWTAVVVRAVDDEDNMSALGPYVVGYTRGFRYSGKVATVTGEPVAGAFVIAGGEIVGVADDQGLWSLEDMPFLVNGVTISDDGEPGPIGDYYDYRHNAPLYNGNHLSVRLFPHYQMESLQHTDFLLFFDKLTENRLFGWPSYLRAFELPIDVYAHPYEREGLDYKATVEQVADELAAEIGFTVFHVVDAPPAVGIECYYSEDVEYDNWLTTEWTEDFYPVKGRIEFRTSYRPNDLALLEKVIRHEMGHALGLGHVLDDIYLMVEGPGVPKADTFTQNEIRVLEIIYGYVGDTTVLYESYLDD
jgi:hypothetical protein